MESTVAVNDTAGERRTPAQSTLVYPTLPTPAPQIQEPVVSTRNDADAQAELLRQQAHFAHLRHSLLGHLGDTQALLRDIGNNPMPIEYPAKDGLGLTLLQLTGRSQSHTDIVPLANGTAWLQRRLLDCQVHVSKLVKRVSDTTSRVLVTGDLNAGKSTLVNALLRRDLVHTDQQPCTTGFCEIVSSAMHPSGAQVVHAITDPSAYNVADRSTFTALDFSALKRQQEARLCKVYVDDDASGLLKNGLADVTLIDSPGLNRDSAKTMAVFAQNSEIDAVIFVVGAENHFTLSVKTLTRIITNPRARSLLQKQNTKSRTFSLP
jgi:mitofusin